MTNRVPALPPLWWQRVRGSSMSPALREGDEVLLTLERAPVLPGDVVVTRGPSGNLILHRVIASGPDAVVTRGDACLHDDQPVPPARVLFRALSLRRGGRVRPIPRRTPGALRLLRSAARRCRGWLRAARGRWSRARRSCSTSTGGASWA